MEKEKLTAVIKNFRRGASHQRTNQFIVIINGITSKAKASSLVGKKVSWKTISGKLIAGRIMQAHGAKGAVRVRMVKGLPGEAVGTPIQIK
ncbi:MAG: 50S ribosomal protein L35ae [archaeon]|nr:50S ribosomal protein L35ae [archaeon]